MPIEEAMPIAQADRRSARGGARAGHHPSRLKPANIKMRDDGTVKVLDFGLANAHGAGQQRGNDGRIADDHDTRPDAGGRDPGHSGVYEPGADQRAACRQAQRRVGVWRVGYEMLTARRAFDGDDVSDTLANVLKGEPDWTALPPAVPPHIRRMLQQCLVKDPRRRVANMGVALFVLNDDATAAFSLPPANAAGAMSHSRRCGAGCSYPALPWSPPRRPLPRPCGWGRVRIRRR